MAGAREFTQQLENLVGPMVQQWDQNAVQSTVVRFSSLLSGGLNIIISHSSKVYECTANVYRQTTDKLMCKSVISTVR